MNFSTSSHNVCGCANQLIAYVGTAWATALMRTYFPADERNFSFHPCIFLNTQSLMHPNKLVSNFSTIVGRPKYLPCASSTQTPNANEHLTLTACGVFLLTTMANFSKFIIWPDATSYLNRQRFTLEASASVALKNKLLSSSKNKWVIGGTLLFIFTPLISFMPFAFVNKLDSPFAQRRKK